MDKQREIPPNAAPRESVASVKKRAEALGLSFHEAAKQAGLSRNTGYKLLRGEGSLGSLREIEDWLIREEAKRGTKGKPDKDVIEEWEQLGRDLKELDPRRFDAMLEGIREIVSARKRERDVLSKMFRANPDVDR
jgi:transcriptional regulator with XRE-family HTH domain